ESRGLNLYLLNKGRQDSGSQGTIRTREGAEAAERGVGNVHTVCHVEVIKRRPTGNRRIGCAAPETVRSAGCQIEEIGHAALYGNVSEDLIIKIRREGGVCLIVFSPRRDGHSFSNVTSLERDVSR